MKVNEIANDVGIAEGLRVIRYAVDEKGNYTQVSSAGWEPVNVANNQAWQQIQHKVAEIEKQVRVGRLSSLAYYMAVNLMDTKLLAQYMGMARWRVELHLRPFFFKRLSARVLESYAALFRVTVDELIACEPSRSWYPNYLMD